MDAVGRHAKLRTEILTNIKSREEVGVQQQTVGEQASGSITEIILHRIDSFDITVRNVLNVGAVMGRSFSLSDVIAVTKESGMTEQRQAEHRRQTIEALQTAVREGILHIGDGAASHEDDARMEDTADVYSDETLFSFHHSVWQSTLVGLMLHSRKRDVHRKIAHSLEVRAEGEELAIDLKRKMFHHWKGAGDTEKATAAALAVGHELEMQHGDPAESVRMYQDTLHMWRWAKNFSDGIAGFNDQVMEFIGADHLTSIIRIMVAMGRALSLNLRHKEGVAAYENALRIMQAAKKAPEIRDRSIIFPAFTGLCNAIARGHISQDVYCRYEQALIRRFLKETRNHGRLIHHIHALHLQLDLYGRLAELEKAIAVQSVIKSLYKPDKHSRGLRKYYEQDSAALSFSRAAYWHSIQGSTRTGLRTSRTVLKDLIPKIETDFMQSFNVIFPILFVLVDAGYATEAAGFFQKVVSQPYASLQAKGGIYDMLRIRAPLLILFDLASKRTIPQDRLDQYVQWAADPERMVFGPAINLRCARLGRCADSISAEICVRLASKVEDCGPALQNATFVANHALIFNRKHGNKVAQNKIHCLLNELRTAASKKKKKNGRK